MRAFSNCGIKTKNDVYIIAEIGLNHNGNIDQAYKLIKSAAKAGVDAVKFQTYISEKRAPKGNQEVLDILKKFELPFEDFKKLKEYAEENKVTFFSTPFDQESLDYLESIDCSMYKVASFDVVNKKLLSSIAQTNKPVIISVGMSSVEEISIAYSIIKKHHDSIALLHCISAYPTNLEDANLAAIDTLKNNFDCVIGQSDHTNDIKIPLYAVARGAKIVEKHYKISDDMDCIDSSVSITEDQMSKLVKEVRLLEAIIGKPDLSLRAVEEPIIPFRRFS